MVLCEYDAGPAVFNDHILRRSFSGFQKCENWKNSARAPLANRGALCTDSDGRDTHQIPLERDFSIQKTKFPILEVTTWTKT